MSIKQGDLIPLRAQLAAADTGKFVRARLRNPAGVEISGSPVALTHVSAGLYINNAIAMPAHYVSAQIQVYTDAGFTALDPLYPYPGEELFTLELEGGGGGGGGLTPAFPELEIILDCTDIEIVVDC